METKGTAPPEKPTVRQPPASERLRALLRERWRQIALLVGVAGAALLIWILVSPPKIDGEFVGVAPRDGSVMLYGKTDWHVEGFVRGFGVETPGTPPVEIGLPLRPSQCRRIASAIGGKCKGRIVHVLPPLVAVWRLPQTVEGGALSGRKVGLTLFPADAPRVLVGSTGGRVTVCFSGPVRNGNRLTLRVGLARVPVPIPSNSFAFACPNRSGVRLEVAGRNPTGPSEATFAGIDRLTLTAESRKALVRGVGGKLKLRDSGGGVDSGQSLSLREAGTLTTSVTAERRRQSRKLTLGGGDLRSAKVGDAERIDRSAGARLTSFAGVVSLVLTLVGAVTGGARGYRWAFPKAAKGDQS